MPNRSVMRIKTLAEEKVNGKLPRFAACLDQGKQTRPQKRTSLTPAGGKQTKKPTKKQADSRFLARRTARAAFSAGRV